MKILGYKLTWRTKCFLGCDEVVWAHTEGNGDFVLFDYLGAPWKIHSHYLARSDQEDWSSRVELGAKLEQFLADLEDFGDERPFRRPAHTIVTDPHKWLRGPFLVKGLVEFYREKRLDHFTKSSTAADLMEINRIFGSRKSELGIVDRNGNLFAIFADLRDTVISPGSLIEVQIGACRVPIRKLGCIFLCHSLSVLPQPQMRPDEFMTTDLD